MSDKSRTRLHASESSILAHLVQIEDSYRIQKEYVDKTNELLEKLDGTALEAAKVLLGHTETEDEEVIRIVKELREWAEKLRESSR